MKLLGIDEAGRGPVLGPFVMAGVMIDAKTQSFLKELGVRDSKDLSRKKREALYKELPRHIISHDVAIVTNTELDEMMAKGINLNMIEARTTAKIINTLNPDSVILDCPSANISGCVNEIRRHLKNPKMKITAEFKADVNYPVVGAASIFAKVIRDNEVDKIKEKYGINCGSGYMADPVTDKFLDDNFDKYPIFRTMWMPWKKRNAKKEQRTLF